VSPRTILISMLALVFGGSVAVGVNSFIQNPPSPKVDVTAVMVAAVDIPRGGTITSDLLKTREFPKDLVPPGSITKVEDAVDRAVFIPLMKDDTIVENKLAPKGSGRGLAALIPQGMRAFTITTTLASGVAGFILPGNKVDVLLTIANVGPTDRTGGGSATTILKNIEILAVDQKIYAPAENKVDVKEMRSVTLLVTPNEANVLELGQSKGSLHLALRHPEDRLPGSTRSATMFDLQLQPDKPWDQRAREVLAALGDALGKARAATPPPSPAVTRKKTIRTIRGSSEGMVDLTPTRDAS
jgi:pilus assembly protein CpaB